MDRTRLRRSRQALRHRPDVEGLEDRRLLAVGMVEFPAPADDGPPGAIAAGPGGRLWIVVGPRIAEVTAAGVITVLAAPGEDPDNPVFLQQLAAGPDGSL